MIAIAVLLLYWGIIYELNWRKKHPIEVKKYEIYETQIFK